ncbi:MAG: hypothetical protein K0S27_598 [Gammaproteobacteria bacterium]|jgi:hypothetical protein|nr:hypothetical protein [Gammaproteobacteria bacterium]
MAKSRQAAAAPAQPPKITEAQTRDNAERLQKAVASLIDQSVTAMESQGQLDVPHIPPLVHPLTAYGYDAPGSGIKKLISGIKKESNQLVLDKKGEESKAGSELNRLVNAFEKQVRDVQKGWMMGEAVEPEALKHTAKTLQRAIAQEELKAEFKELEDDKVEKVEKIKAQLADFSTRIDEELARLRARTEERVHFNESMIVHHKIAIDAKGPQNSPAKKRAGECGLLHWDEARIKELRESKMNDKWDELLKNPDNNKPDFDRAYIIVAPSGGGQPKVCYVDKITKEITPAEKAPPFPGDVNQWFADMKMTLPGKGTRGVALTSTQERWMKGKAQHDPERYTSWQTTLPRRAGDEQELKNREREQAECTDLCGGDVEKGAAMARDKAWERLEGLADDSMKEVAMVYDSGGEQFNVHRRKDDEKGGMVFTVQYQDKNKSDKYFPKAIAAMIELCHKHDPLSLIELDCPKIATEYGGKEAAKKVMKQIESAVKAAEASSKKGIPIGLSLGANAEEALAIAGNTDLPKRIMELQTEWKKSVALEQEKKKETASARYSEKSELGAALEQPVRDVPAIGNDAALEKAFKTQEGRKRLDELKNECQKLENTVKQLELASHSISDQLHALEKEIEKQEVQESDSKLIKIAESIEGLKADQEAVNLKLAHIAGFQELHQRNPAALKGREGHAPGAVPVGGAGVEVLHYKDNFGVAANYRARILGANATRMLQAGVAPGDQPAQQAAQETLADKVDKVGERAAQRYNENILNAGVRSNLVRLGTLEEKVKTHQEELAKKALHRP